MKMAGSCVKVSIIDMMKIRVLEAALLHASRGEVRVAKPRNDDDRDATAAFSRRMAVSESWWPYHYYVGEVVYPPNATYGPRIQQDYQLVMLHAGSLTLSVDSESYSFDAGVVILLHPGHTEFFRFSPNSRTHHSWICVRGPEMPPNLLKTINQLPRAIPLSQRMNYLAQEAVYWNQAVVRPKHLLLSIASNAFFLYLEEASGAGTSLRKECEAVSIVKQYIHRHYERASDAG